ncbi:hypothetical protein DL768_000721 [Monosporascus sp. mg162]|nr:hypothetical protein DL768_000721 [Monosporascus sp. mg162]
MTRVFGFLVGSLALYDVVLRVSSAASRNNVVLYYKRPSQYYADPSIGIIILSAGPKRTRGPATAGQNKPTSNRLLKCPNLQRDLYTCRQTSTKKILLSLGGGTTAYQLRDAVDGENLAKKPCSKSGPRQSSWVNHFGGVAIRGGTYVSENVASGENFCQNLKAARAQYGVHEQEALLCASLLGNKGLLGEALIQEVSGICSQIDNYMTESFDGTSARSSFGSGADMARGVAGVLVIHGQPRSRIDSWRILPGRHPGLGVEATVLSEL